MVPRFFTGSRKPAGLNLPVDPRLLTGDDAWGEEVGDGDDCGVGVPGDERGKAPWLPPNPSIR